VSFVPPAASVNGNGYDHGGKYNPSEYDAKLPDARNMAVTV
jgi:hypothetical protein